MGLVVKGSFVGEGGKGQASKGFTQTYGIDYEEAFAPIAKIKFLPLLLFIAANPDWPLFQLDVQNAFLKAKPGGSVGSYCISP